MFDEKSLKELASVEANTPILSVYLNVDPKQRTAEEYKLVLREMLRNPAGMADKADITTVKNYVDLEYDWSGRGLVIFSCQAEGLWQVFPISVPVRSGITVAHKPYISPLVELSGIYGRYVVAVVDQQGGRFFSFQMGELAAHEGIAGEDVHRTRRGRGSSVVGMRGGSPLSGRKEAEVVHRNLREIAEGLTSFCEQHKPRRLLLAGAEHTIAEFKECLPVRLQQIIVSTFAVEMGASEIEIRDLSFALLKELEEQRKQELVETVITAAAKGSNGVVRLDETLSAANEGRVQVLVVEHDYHNPGYKCTGCGYLTTQQLETCVFCGGEFVDISDAVEAVVSQVVEKGGTVEVVDNEQIKDAHIGALLRY
ncbi:MAG: hypothetical protein JXA33_27815 [Anaerolineae bacterium]|nr:hypothetical protein [Anaerolineae bacterium]